RGVNLSLFVFALDAPGNALMGNSSATFMGSFLASSLGSAPAHPAGPTASPSEPAFRSPHSATSQIWFSHSHEVPGYSRFSGSLASTFLPMSHLDHHGNGNSVLYGQHHFYETQKDGFYLRNLPGQPTLLSTNHGFPSIPRNAPGHPNSCSRDREVSQSQKSIKESERLLSAKESGKERMSKSEGTSVSSQRTQKERHSEGDGKDRHKIVLPLMPDVRCKDDTTSMHGSICDNRNKHLNSCLTNSKVMNGDSSKNLLSSCTNIGGILPRQMDIHTPGRCTKESLRFERDFRENGSCGPMHSECSDSWQTAHHSSAYSVPSSLSNIPPPSSTASGTFPCLQVHSNLDLFYPNQEKAGRELKVTGPTFVPSVGHFHDKTGPFQVTAENCRVSRSIGKEKTHEKGTDRSDIRTIPSSHALLKADGKGMDWAHNSAMKSKQQCGSTGAQMVMPFTPQAAKGPSGKGSTYVMPQSQDCFCSKEMETCCAKLTHSGYMLDREHGHEVHERASKDSHGQKVARIRHQHHKLSEVEHIGSSSEMKRRPPELSCMSYNGSHLPPWQGHQIPMGEDRKNSYLDPFSSSLQQASMLSQGSVLNQDMLGQTDEVSAMKSLLKYSSSFPPGTQTLIVGQKTPFGGLGNIRASCVHQEIKFQSGKSHLDLERPDCAKGREGEPSHGDGEVRQPPVGIAVAVARQKDTHNKHEMPCGPDSSKHSRHMPGLKGPSRSTYIIDLEAEEENNHLREERMGLTRLDREREHLLRENKELMEFARIRPSSGCPGDLNPNLMVTGGSSIQASQLGTDHNAHPHLTPPHWLPRTGSPSVWMGGHSYGIGHPALHSNLPPGFPASMPSAMQTVFPLSQDPSAQLVILPTEPPAPHSTPHHLAEVIDPAHSLWPSIYPARAPTTHIQHPGQLSVYPRSQLLRQQELYMLQQQQQQQQQQQHQQQQREPVLERNRRSHKTVALNSPKSHSSPVILPPGMCSTKLSPCRHSPSLRPKSGCPTPQPTAMCPLPSCPTTTPAIVAQSPAIISPPSQNSARNETAEKRTEGQPPQDYPQSFEPVSLSLSPSLSLDLPPGYTYSNVAIGYTSPTPLVHSADLADPQTMQPVSTAAEPEQARTFTPGEQIHCETQQSTTLGDASPTDRHVIANELDPEEQNPRKTLRNPEEKKAGSTFPAENSTQGQLESSAQEKVECSRHLIAAQGTATDTGILGDESGQGSPLMEPPPQGSQFTTLTNDPVDVQNSDNSGPVIDTDFKKEWNIAKQVIEEKEEEGEDEEEEEIAHDAYERDEVFKWRLDCMAGMDALVAAGLSMGELLALESEVPRSSMPSSHTTTSTFYPCSGMHGIALLSELADLEHQRQMGDGTSQGNGTLSYTVCPLKAAIDRMDTQELEMRMRLAKLQRRYKEKQRELAKLQRRHDNERDENSRSPARRGPGRPRKRKLLSTVLSSFGQLSELVHCFNTQQIYFWSKCFHILRSELDRHMVQSCWITFFFLFPSLSLSLHSVDMSDDDDNYNSADSSDCIAELPMKELGLRTEYSPAPIPAEIGPSPSSIVKLEANQKAKKKKERQGTLGFCNADGDVKIKKRPARPGMDSSGTVKKLEKLPANKKKGIKMGEKPKKLKNAKGGAEVTIWRRLESNLRPLLYGERLFPSANSVPTQMASRSQAKKGSANRCKKITRKSKVLQAAFKVKGRAVSKLLESFAAEDDFEFDEDSSFSEEDENASVSCSAEMHLPRSCAIHKEDLKEGLQILIPKEDKLLYTMTHPHLVQITGERGNRQRIYSLEQLLQEAVLDVRPPSTRFLPPDTRVCAYWSQKSRCLYPGTVIQSREDCNLNDFVTVEFDDGDVGRISLSNIRLLPPEYKIQCTEPSPALLVSNGRRRIRRFCNEKQESAESSFRPVRQHSLQLNKTLGRKTSVKGKAGKGVLNSEVSTLLRAGHVLGKKTDALINWPGIAQTKKKALNKNTAILENLFQLNGSTRRMKVKERFLPMHGLPRPVFSSGFEVDSFSSIANTFGAFGGSPSLAANPKPLKSRKVEKLDMLAPKGGRKKSGMEFLVKLDHEGVMSPKTKNGKALLMSEKEFGVKLNTGYSQSVLVSKDRKGRVDLLKGKHAQLQNLPLRLAMTEYTGQSDFRMDCDSDSHSSYSDMDDEDENGNLRDSVTSRYMSRLSVSSSSSASSSSSTSGSTSTSSLCSSDNDDSSYSSDDDSTLLLQTCMTHPVPAMLAPSEPLQTETKMSPHSFSAKSVMPTNKAKLKRQEELSLQKAKELAKRQRLPSVENRPKISSFLPARQLWKWSGKPTQRRGMKGKAKKLYYKAIVRGKETICVGDCAVFLSVGRPNLPYIGRIESMWESWGSNMVVKVKWFYHPEETKLGKKSNDGKRALYQSCHEDENDVQTISHKCQVVNLEQYEQMIKTKKYQDSQDLYYLAGTYDPTIGRILNADGVPSLC
uniref:BAH domain and coiled-coil containing 1 n=1 Tax=Callorhinchus milii TaxID=7868 RepID=A0A4W3K3D3_CALMI